MAKNFDFPWDPPKPPKGPRPKDKFGRPMEWSRTGDRRNSRSGWQWSPMSDVKARDYDKRAPKMKADALKAALDAVKTKFAPKVVPAPKVTPKPEIRTKDGSSTMPKSDKPKGYSAPPVKTGKGKTYRNGM